MYTHTCYDDIEFEICKSYIVKLWLIKFPYAVDKNDMYAHREMQASAWAPCFKRKPFIHGQGKFDGCYLVE